MVEEIESLYFNDTQKLAELLKGKKVIGCKCVFLRSPGGIVHYKARLVVKGYTKRESIDYNKVFSPIVAQYDYELDQLNVETAFLHDDLEEKI